MAQASRDQNKVPALLCTSNQDGVTTLLAYADPTNGALLVEDGTGGSALSGAPAKRDQNKEPALTAVSSEDGITPIPVYINADSNRILINSN